MIVSAAVRYLMDDRDMITLPVHRHKDADLIMRVLPLADDGHEWIKVQEGFITEEYEFLDRRGALDEAIRCGQISADDPHGYDVILSGKLMSEDLW